jgi:transcriptional regulator of acetoin/glycerol metabolism
MASAPQARTTPAIRREREARRPIASALPLPAAHVGIIEQSHDRCAALGLSRIERPDFAPLGRTDLVIARERNQRLHTHAAPVMEMLFDQIAGTESMVVLCDAAGTIIHSIGDDDFLERASKVALRPGVNWSEHAKGTNAIGTALIEELPTLVHADEHFMHANHFLTCSAVPILDPRGSMLGVLDVTGDHRGYHQHTMALVKMSARMIENHWLSDDYRDAMRLHFHGRVDFIGTLMEGILAVSPQGRLVGANRGALELLGLSGAALRMQNLGSLFGTSVGALVDRFRSPLATPMPVHTAIGTAFHVLARFTWPVWSQVADAAAVATSDAIGKKPTLPLVRGAATTGLARLDTGDAQMKSVIAKVLRVLDRDIPILISGETGTGKVTLARAIHRDSARATQPFVAINCSSTTPDLLETELFGREASSDGGTRRAATVGKIQQASGGTLFLDEIGDMPAAAQVRLLQVLQQRATPARGTASVPVDLAIICATRRGLSELTQGALVRDDLYYRINGLSVKLPPLRDRTDLDMLVRGFIEREAAGERLQLSSEVQDRLRTYAWPGNVRQLFNVLRAAVLMAAGERVIRCEHLPDDFLEDARRNAGAPLEKPWVPEPGPAIALLTGLAAPGQTTVPTRSLADLEIDAIRAAVDAAGGNISEAAKRLGVSRNTIYRKLRWSRACSD